MWPPHFSQHARHRLWQRLTALSFLEPSSLQPPLLPSLSAKVWIHDALMMACALLLQMIRHRLHGEGLIGKHAACTMIGLQD